MFRKSLSILFNDAPRGDDRGTPSLAEKSKPPVLRRRTLNLLGVCLLAVVFYGSLMPFEIRSEWAWTWRLTLHKPAPPDFVTNVILYLPIGVFLRLFYRRRGTRSLSEIAMSLVTIGAVSYGTELCQNMLVARVASLTDVISNVAGAAAGIVLAPIAQRGMRNLHGWLYAAMRQRPFTASAALLTITLFALALTPFDPMPTRAHLQPRLDAVLQAESLFPFGAGWGGDRDADVEGALSKALAAGAYGVLACLLLLAERERGRPPGRGASYALTRVAALAAGIELVQLFTISHVFDPVDLTGAWICAGLGTLAAYGWLVTKREFPFRRLTVIKILALVALTASFLWVTLPSLSVEQPGSSSLRIGLPMLNNFHMSWNALLGRYTVEFLRYALIAAAVVAWRRSDGRAPREWMILTAVTVALMAIMALAWWNNRPFDSCHLFLAGLAAVLVRRSDAALFGRTPRGLGTEHPSFLSQTPMS